jgi:hypothetical protein
LTVNLGYIVFAPWCGSIEGAPKFVFGVEGDWVDFDFYRGIGNERVCAWYRTSWWCCMECAHLFEFDELVGDGLALFGVEKYPVVVNDVIAWF